MTDSDEDILRRRIERLAEERLDMQRAFDAPPEDAPYRGDGIADLRRERDQALTDRDSALARAQEVAALASKWRGRASMWENMLAVVCLLFVMATLGFLAAFKGYLTQNRRADLCEEVLRKAGDAGTPGVEGR